jgi:phosphoribosylformylglycinamidine cyclo-ligase
MRPGGRGAAPGAPQLPPRRPPAHRAGRIHALAHITGGGIPGNLNRSIPDPLQARVDTVSWEVPAEFRGVMEAGGIEEREMFETFNMGVGLILVVPETEAQSVVDALVVAGEAAWVTWATSASGRTVRHLSFLA